MNDTVGTLLDLAAKNPDLPIVPMVDSDVVPDDGHMWWLGRIGDVRIGKYTTTDPDICFMNPLGMFGNKDTDYCTALADALELLSSCEAVIFCPGWEESTGCRAEKAFAIQQGIRIMYLEDFPEAMRRLTDIMVQADLAQALKKEIMRKQEDIKTACVTTVKVTGGEIIYGDGNDE